MSSGLTKSLVRATNKQCAAVTTVRGATSVPVQKLRFPLATLLTLPMADQGHSVGGTGNRLLGATSALGSLGRGLEGVGRLGVHRGGGLPSLNEGCASAVAICKKINEPNATRRKMRFSFIFAPWGSGN